MMSNRKYLFITLAVVCVLMNVSYIACSKTASDTATVTPAPIVVTGLITSISVSGSSTCAVRGGYVKCWGGNLTGNLGLGNYTNYITPQLVSGLSDIKKVDTYSGRTCALSNSKQLYCWGKIDNTTNQNTPILVSSLNNVTDFSVGMDQICAINSGSLYCWGYTSQYLPVGSTISGYNNTPTLIPSLTNVTLVASGEQSICAVSNAKLYCWGYNSSGEFGNGTTTPSATPVDLSGHWFTPSSISLRFRHLCTASSGTISCAGYNYAGQVYSQPSISIVTPIKNPTIPYGLTSGTFVNTGDGHTCAITGSSEIKCWGHNVSYSLGINSYQNIVYQPTIVAGINKNIIAFSSGIDCNCVSFSDETMSCWGSNYAGALGNGNQIDQSSPVPVLGM